MYYTNQVLENFKKEKYNGLLQTIFVDLTDMQLISKFNKRFKFSLCVIDIYSKCAQVIRLKYKKGITITQAFQKILKESNRKPNKIWVDKGRKFYNISMKSWLQKNDIEMYSTHDEGKSFIAERFIEFSSIKFINT